MNPISEALISLSFMFCINYFITYCYTNQIMLNKVADLMRHLVIHESSYDINDNCMTANFPSTQSVSSLHHILRYVCVFFYSLARATLQSDMCTDWLTLSIAGSKEGSRMSMWICLHTTALQRPFDLNN